MNELNQAAFEYREAMRQMADYARQRAELDRKIDETKKRIEAARENVLKTAMIEPPVAQGGLITKPTICIVGEPNEETARNVARDIDDHVEKVLRSVQ